MVTSDGNTTNTYEEARKLRLEENKKRFEDLGIIKLSKSLTELSHSHKKAQPKQHLPNPRQKSDLFGDPRRSTRTRNPIKSYCDEVDIGISFHRKRIRSSSHSTSSSWASYLARPIEEVKTATYEQRNAAFKAAEKVQESLKTENPSFVKSMVRSHVYSCFWLGLPSKFCDENLPKSLVDIELEDEEGNKCDAVYIGKRKGLSGGWRGFALEHKLDDGDALVFDLVEPSKFKIYIVRVSMVDAKDEVTEARKKSKLTTLGFKQTKKSAVCKTNGSAGLKGSGHVKDECEPKIDGIVTVDEEAKGARRSKRKLATVKSSY